MRVDLYSLVHKAQRFHLFRLANDIGTGASGDAEAMAPLGHCTLQMLDHLEDHAHNEDHYIHALFHQIGCNPARLESEHQQLAEVIAKLRSLVADQRWGSLHDGVSALITAYLAHIEEEERLQRDVLWPAYSDAELMTVMQRFKAEREASKAQADLEFFLHALSVAEIIRIYQAMKTSAPAAAYAGACDIAAHVLRGERREKVLAAV